MASAVVLLASPATGGVAVVARRAAAELGDRGWSVRSVRLDSGGVPALRAARALLRHRHALRGAKVVHVEFGSTDLAAFWFALGASLARPDLVVVAHDMPALALAPASGLVGSAPGWRDALGHRVLGPLLDRRLRRVLTRRAAVGVALSERAGALWEGEGPRSVTVLDHGADPPSDRRLAPSEGRHVLFAGHLTPGRGLETLVEAWERVGPAAGLPLVIAGGLATDNHAGWLRSLQARAEASSAPPRWLGRVDDEAFARLFAEAAVVVVPYLRSNPASGVLVRAAVEGRAIVSSDVPAAEGLISDGETGNLVAPGDATALAGSLEALLGDPGLRDRLGDAAMRRAAGRHTWPRHVAGLEAAYAMAEAA